MYNDNYRKRFSSIPAAISFGTFRLKDLDDAFLTYAHNHSDCELFTVKSGAVKMIVDGKEIAIKAGESVIVNPYEIHAVAAVSDVGEYFCITFELSVLSSIAQHSVAALCKKLLAQEVCFVNFTQSNEVFHLISEIERMFRDKHDGWEFFVSADIFRIFAIFIAADMCKGMQGKRTTLFSRRVHEFIEMHYSQRITSRDAADALSYDKSYFCRLFKKNFGKTFGEYLTFFRINKAKEMLLSGITVAEAAEKVGIDSFSYFTRSFKKHALVLPSRYAKENGKELFS